MTASYRTKFHEAFISVIPVMAVVVLLHYTIAPLGPGELAQFLVGGILLIIGLAVFLIGADIGMVPFGQRVGSGLTKQRNLPIILLSVFAIGFAITIAEPDVQVLARQVSAIDPSVSRGLLLVMIGVGVGLFLMLGTMRIVLQLSLRLLLLIFYALVFLVCAFVDPGFIGVAFDAGGATTGPITVPFIMALGIGVASSAKKREGDDSSFGMVGLASIGPIAAVAAMGLASSGGFSATETGADGSAHPMSLVSRFLFLLPGITHEIAAALLPILLLFLLFQAVLLRMPALQMKRKLFGFLYAFIGLVLFMTGVQGGFIPAGQSLGFALGGSNTGPTLVLVGFFLGAVVVCAEPAVWILTEQIEEVSGGYIKRPIMMGALSLSIACAVALGMTRVVTGLSIWYVLLPGYILALVLTRFTPPLFTAIAFDSGGVASGPMSATFVLALTLGASKAAGGNPTTDAFGMIAMIAMAPLVTIQVLGLIFKRMETQRAKRDSERRPPHEPDA